MKQFCYILFLCSLVQLMHNSEAATACPSGWTAASDGLRCFKAFVGAPLSWFAAESACQALGQNGHLVSVRSVFDQTTIIPMVSGSAEIFWMGASDYQSGAFAWSDNANFTYTNWNPGQPSGPNDGRNCGHSVFGVGLGKWGTLICIVPNNYICEVEPSDTTCPFGYTRGTVAGTTDYCYSVYQALADPISAELMCTTVKVGASIGHLAWIESATENEMIRELADALGASTPPVCDPKRGYYWIGAIVTYDATGVTTTTWTNSNPPATCASCISNFCPDPPTNPSITNQVLYGELGVTTCFVPPSTQCLRGQWRPYTLLDPADPSGLTLSALPFICKISAPQP